MPIQMHIYACLIAHNALDGHQVLVHPVQVALFIPHVTIHLFFKGFQFLNIEFRFCLLDSCRHLGIATNIHLLGIVGTTGERWVNIYKVNLNTFVFEIGTSRKAFATNHQIVGILAYLLFQLHLVKGHTTLHSLQNLVVVTIAQNSFGANEIV